MGDIKQLEDGSFKIQHGKVLTRFKIDEGRITLLDKDGEPKSFTFVSSDPALIQEIGGMLLDIAHHWFREHPKQEVVKNGHRYVLAPEPEEAADGAR